MTHTSLDITKKKRDSHAISVHADDDATHTSVTVHTDTPTASVAPSHDGAALTEASPLSTDTDSARADRDTTVAASTADHAAPLQPPADLPRPAPTAPHDDTAKTSSVVFMGTGVFAADILTTLLQSSHYRVVHIVTQPDKKIGRKKKSSINRTLAANPVRDLAVEHSIPLLQPVRLDDDIIGTIARHRPDLLIVASYGRILPQKLLDTARIAPVNVHASLLPLLRGASPIHNAILHGHDETGITIMLMDAGMDTGAILAQQRTVITAHEKTSQLCTRLARIGGDLLLPTLDALVAGRLSPQPQDHSRATLCQLIEREDGHIQWTDTTAEIYNRYRALYPWPGVFSFWEIHEAQIIRIHFRAILPSTTDLEDAHAQLIPGTVFVDHGQLCVKTGDGAIIVEAVQPECKVVMPVYDFLNGHKDFDGALLK